MYDKQTTNREISTAHWAANNYTLSKQSLHTAKINLYTVEAVITHCENFLTYLRKIIYTLNIFIYSLIKLYKYAI